MIHSWDEIGEDLHLSCDAVIVGSGAGGAPVAALLAEAGWSVIVLEEGGHHPTESFTPNAANAYRRLYHNAGTDFLLGAPPIMLPRGRTLGGSTVINLGTAMRSAPEKFSEWREKFGLEGLTDAHLEPYFNQAERDLGIERAKPKSLNRSDQKLLEGTQGSSWKAEILRRNAPNCKGCGVCSLGCPSGAKQSTLVSYLPRALKAGAEIYCDAKATRLVFQGRKATGVSGSFLRRYTQKTVRRFEIQSPRVILAAGAMGTPLFIQRAQPPGFDPKSSPIGNNLHLHPTAYAVALFDDPIRGWEGIPQGIQLTGEDQPRLRGAGGVLHPAQMAMALPGFGHAHKALMARFAHMAHFGVMIEDLSSGEIRSAGSFEEKGSYSLIQEDADLIKFGLRKLTETFLGLGAEQVILGAHGTAPILSKKRNGALEAIENIPTANLHLTGFHPMGTCAMSATPDKGGTDINGKAWGYEGLYVSDASLFPSALGVHPQLTVAALGLRLANHLMNRRDSSQP